MDIYTRNFIIFTNAIYSVPVNDRAQFQRIRAVLVSSRDYLDTIRYEPRKISRGTVERLTAYMESTGRW